MAYFMSSLNGMSGGHRNQKETTKSQKLFTVNKTGPVTVKSAQNNTLPMITFLHRYCCESFRGERKQDDLFSSEIIYPYLL